MTTTIKLAYAVRPMALERVHFFDGMILTADDLEAERHYHLTRSRMINRAVFGCGIACGLEVEKHPAADPATRFVCVRPGIAFDCRGDPLELCRPVKLDLDPDPCKEPPGRVCILIRRRDGKPRSSDPCSCGKPSGSEPRRLLEEVEIRAVDPRTSGSLEGVCWSPPKQTPSHDAGDCHDEPEGQPEHDLCACLKECERCEDRCEGWVLLACVDLVSADDADCCPGPDRDRSRIAAIDDRGRKYIKPIRCHCPPKEPQRPKDPEAPKDPKGEVPKGEVPKDSHHEGSVDTSIARPQGPGDEVPKPPRAEARRRTR